MEFRVLGPVQVLVNGYPIELGDRKRRLVLATLLLEANRLVPLVSLVDMLWRDAPPQSARRTVQAHLSRLRTLLTAAGAVKEGVSLDRVGSGYLLRSAPERIDVHRFGALLDRARHSADDHDRARLLRDALALWRGPALADVANEDVRERLCDGLQESRLTAVEEYVDAKLRLGQHAELIQHLTNLVAQYPARHQLAARLMLALHRAGRQSDALRVYDQVRRRLSDELGIDPSPEMQRLHVAILREDPGLKLVSATGERAAAPAPAQLPADTVDFTGRALPLRHLDQLIPDEDAQERGGRVAVITGIAGIGKTALACHWAHLRTQEFAGGQLYVNLRGFGPAPPLTAMQALTSLLGGLGVRHVPQDLEDAAALYRSCLNGRRVLVVLDDATSAEQVRPLLPGGPGCLALVTSRDRLVGLVAREGARQIRLEVLSHGEAHALLCRLVGGERVRAEPAAAAALARLCGYLPLALRIAAANLATGHYDNLAGYVAALHAGDLLDKLTVAGDEPSDLRAALSFSYQALPGPARRGLCQLSLAFGAELSEDAVVALWGEDPLTSQHILQRLANANLVDRLGNGRYAMRSLVQCYAYQQLRQEHSARARSQAARRLLVWYGELVESAARLLYPLPLRHVGAGTGGTTAAFADRAQALAWLETERANLVAILKRVATEPDLAPREVVRLAQLLYPLCYRRGYLDDWVTINEAARVAARQLGDLAAEARACADLGLAWEQMGQYERAMAVLRQALVYGRDCADAPTLSTCLNSMGIVHGQLGALDRAQDCFEEALALRVAHGDRYGEALSLSSLGLIAAQSGNVDRARSCHERSMALFREVRSPWGEALSMHCLGLLDEQLHRYPEACRWYADSALSLRRSGDRLALTYVLGDLGRVYRLQGRRAPALTSLSEALGLCQELGVRRRQADCLQELALLLHTAAPQEAQRHWEAALTILPELGLAPRDDVRAALTSSAAA